MKLVLSTSNIMGGGPSVVRRSGIEKSNAELTSSLRENFAAHKESASKPGHEHWTTWKEGNNALYIPAPLSTPLAEERQSYDITVKLFYLPNVPGSERGTHTREAVQLVLDELKVPSIDLLIVSFPGLVFDAEDEDLEEEEAELLAAEPNGAVEGDELEGGVESIESMAATWETLEALHEEGLVLKLGVAEFSAQRLSRLFNNIKVRPSVDQINVRDCCVVPKSLILFGRQEKVELLTHNDCTNILPRGTLRELLGSSEKGVGILSGSEGINGGLKGDVVPKWVVKYTAVVKDRGVVENKGYFAVAELQQP